MNKALSTLLLAALPCSLLASELAPYALEQTRADDPSIPNANSSSSIDICIVDSGYDLGHPDLPIATGSDRSQGSGGWTNDLSASNGYHGTAVAGVMAALHNTQGSRGVNNGAANINLHMIKAQYAGEINQGIIDCINRGADIINVSAGNNSASSFQSAIDLLDETQTLLVASAGNLWAPNAANDQPFYPASFDKALSVAATDSDARHAHYSIANNQVDIAAPGTAIYTPAPRGRGFTASIRINGTLLPVGNREIVPANRYTWHPGTGALTKAHFNGSVNAQLVHCSGSICPASVTNNICLVERVGNDTATSISPVGTTYNYRNLITEYKSVDKCDGAAAVIIYSNAARAGLQAPFLVDEMENVSDNFYIAQYNFPVVSVSRELGLYLAGKAGQSATVNTATGSDYGYASGTSFAAPYVSGIAARIWSLFPNCNAYQIRNALIRNANDANGGGWDKQLGAGIIDTKATYDDLAQNGCGADEPPPPPPTVEAPQYPPLVHTEFSGCQGTTPRFVLSWSTAEAIDGYKVHEKRGSQAWRLYYKGTNGGAMYYGLNNTTTKIRVVSYNAGGNSPRTTVTLPSVNCGSNPPPPIF
ncbi:MAG: S8 family serine peptidase [Gammaproteobacteria bacterium]|nr:S8 family serine peptidase [Gammaproteobacteria bacterium]